MSEVPGRQHLRSVRRRQLSVPPCSPQQLKLKLKQWCILNGSWKPISELQGVACHMWSHNVTCHPTHPALNPSRWRLILDLPTPEEWKAVVDKAVLFQSPEQQSLEFIDGWFASSDHFVQKFKTHLFTEALAHYRGVSLSRSHICLFTYLHSYLILRKMKA